MSVIGLSVVLVAVFLAAAATNLIGIFAIFWRFVLGAAFSDRHQFRDAVGRRLREIVYALFLPIFFTYTDHLIAKTRYSPIMGARARLGSFEK